MKDYRGPPEGKRPDSSKRPGRQLAARPVITMLPTKGVPDAELALGLILDALRAEAIRIRKAKAASTADQTPAAGAPRP